MPKNAETVLTIGHSTRELNEFIGLLKRFAVEQIVDVRTIPRSRHNPQFNLDTVSDSLKAERISYAHMPGLGGLRRPKANSVNTGWRNASFRGFADYMQTQEFEEKFASYVGSKHVIGLNSGTAALHLALMGYHLGPGVDCRSPAARARLRTECDVDTRAVCFQ